MSWWGNKAQAVTEPAPIAAVDRVSQLQAEMALAKSVLDVLNAEIVEFRILHGIEEVDRLDQIVRMRGNAVTARARVAPLWRALQQRKGRALHAFSRAQKAWSEAVIDAAKNRLEATT
jgi:hypothetical protein